MFDEQTETRAASRDLELYVKAGFSPLEALQTATIAAARAMKKDGDSGARNNVVSGFSRTVAPASDRRTVPIFSEGAADIPPC